MPSDLAALLTPVIFANGVDDDLPGLVAALENRPVLLDEQIIAPGKPVVVERRNLGLSRGLHIIGPHDVEPILPADIAVVRYSPERVVTISHNSLFKISKPRA